jgi:outer membrane beta-barrel protein
MRYLLLASLLLAPAFAFAEEEEQKPEADAAPVELEGIAAPEEAGPTVAEPDGTVSAVQARMFQMHHELSLGVGFLPSDAYTRGICAQVAYTYHFSDSFAWRVGRGFFSYGLSTGLREQLERRYSVAPSDFDRVEWAVGSDLILSPLYGKSAFFNRSLLWFEVYVLGGASAFKLNSGFSPAASIGAGVRVFRSQNLSVRFDALNHFLFPVKRLSVFDVQLSVSFNFGGAEQDEG